MKRRMGVRTLFVLTMGLAIALPLGAAEIDLEGLPAGYMLDFVFTGHGVSGALSGSVGIFGFSPAFGAVNAAIVFDSACPPGGVPGDCSGGDYDLGTPNFFFGGPGWGVGGEPGMPFENDIAQGNVAIVAEDLTDSEPDGLIDDPDDGDVFGSYVEFDFSGLDDGTATVNSFRYIDNDEGEFGAQVDLWGPGTGNPSTIGMPAVGDNGAHTISPGLSGVDRMRVTLNGSGAVDSVVIEEEVVRDCWVTTGGFNNADTHTKKGKKTCTFGGNVGPPPSGALEVNWHEGALDGAKFHTNDIVSVECINMRSTGPGQPGGKKGLEVDTLLFTCNGKFNNEDGYTCEGFLKDAGEPQGKKGNGYDQIRMIVKDAIGDVVATCGGDLDVDDPMDGTDLHGGNVQIHPPVGKP
jgi:hypothetical protein